MSFVDERVAAEDQSSKSLQLLLVFEKIPGSALPDGCRCSRRQKGRYDVRRGIEVGADVRTGRVQVWRQTKVPVNRCVCSRECA